MINFTLRKQKKQKTVSLDVYEINVLVNDLY